jgi:hypothetical protein
MILAREDDDQNFVLVSSFTTVRRQRNLQLTNGSYPYWLIFCIEMGRSYNEGKEREDKDRGHPQAP